MTRRLLGTAAVLVASGACATAEMLITGDPGSTAWHLDTVPAVRLVFVGDTGTGDDRSRRVVEGIRHQSEAVPVSHVFLLGDNVYEHGEAEYIDEKFLDVYRGVFSAGVKVQAAFGNHDIDRCVDSELRPVPRDGSVYGHSDGCDVEAHLATPEFGYPDGLRYYSVEIPRTLPDQPGAGASPQSQEPPLVEVFVLDSNTLGRNDQMLAHGTDEPQLRWLAEALRSSRARWKVVAMHHPVYAPTRCHWYRFGCRSEDEALRAELEPLFIEHGVDVVFQAHQHLYARLWPQHGIRYFVAGGGGRRTNSFWEDERTVPRRDRGDFNHYVYVMITEDEFGYCAIDAAGVVRDGGSFRRGEADDGPFELCSPPGR